MNYLEYLSCKAMVEIPNTNALDLSFIKQWSAANDGVLRNGYAASIYSSSQRLL